jgi:hypothetical protein
MSRNSHRNVETGDYPLISACRLPGVLGMCRAALGQACTNENTVAGALGGLVPSGNAVFCPQADFAARRRRPTASLVRFYSWASKISR